jgi:hypothetical protein
MTPGYASPEQATGAGPSIAGDVFSLGCILRDILAPIVPEADLRAVRDRCLAHSPADRYGSAQEISADILRYLSHLPVRAHDSSLRYVTLKFVRRNRLACCLAVCAILVLLAGSLLSWQNARRADLYQERHRALVSHLVEDKGPIETPESSQGAAMAGSTQDAIAHLEAMTPQPLPELAAAWRRLSYSHARSGRTQEGIESIQRSIEYARRSVAADGSPEARAGLAESLLYATTLRNRRGEIRPAGDHGVEAVRLIEALPAAQRSAIERKPEFFFALFSAARRMAQSRDIQSGRDLLLEGLKKSRALGKSLQLRMLLDLAAFERKAGNADRSASYCAEATALELTNRRLETLCKTQPLDPQQRAAGLVHQVSLLERRLVLDPENFADRQQLARLSLELARTTAAMGDTTRAGQLIEEATVTAKPLIDADPDNRKLRTLARRIENSRKPGRNTRKQGR